MLLGIFNSSNGQTIYSYTNAASGAYASLDPNLTASTLGLVGTWGSNTPCTAGGGISGITVGTAYATFNPGNASAPALNVNITPNTGYTMSVTSLSVSLRRSGSGPAKARLAYSTNGGTTWIDDGVDYVPNNGSCGAFANYTWTLSTALQVCSGTLKVRVYYFAPGASSGTCQTANLKLNGVVAPLPVASVSIAADQISLCAGVNDNFTATPVGGGTNPVYTWYKNGNVVGNSSNLYSDNTLTNSDVITCSMQSNAVCVSSTPVMSNAISVTIHQPVSFQFSDTACAATVYSWANQSLTVTGTYNATFSSSFSCDSVVTLHLFVRPAISKVFADTICANGTYNWAGQSFTSSGSYSNTFTSVHNCDSNVTLNLYVRPAIAHNFSDTICAAGTYTWGGQTLTTSGLYNHTYTSYKGCDSAVSLNLFVRPAVVNAISDTICAASSYVWANQTFTTSGIYNHTFAAYTNCDSLVTLHLFVRPSITHNFSDTICAAGSYAWGGQTLTTSGSYNHTFTSYTNCDSLVNLQLYVRPAITNAVYDTICAATSYTWAAQTFSTSGSYSHTFTAYTNCDSVVMLHLFVRPAIAHTAFDTICAATAYAWGGQSLTSSGSYNHTFTSYTNCDSVVTLNLFVRPAIAHTFADTICAAATYAWGGQTFTTSGSYNHTFTSFTNCDSVVTLQLFVRPAIANAVYDTICAATSYTWANQTYSTSGSYNHTFTAYTNCDSVVTLHLLVRPANTYTFNDTICATGSYTWGAQTLTVSGVYNHTYTSYVNCDSLVTLHLFVRPANTNAVSKTICFGTSYTFGPQNLSSAGVYTHAFSAANGCDSTVTLTLNITPLITNSVAKTICAGTSFNWGVQNLSVSGTYTQTFTAASLCDSIVTLSLTVNLPIGDTINKVICYGTNYAFGGQTLTTSGTYNHVFVANNGCDSTVQLHLTVSPQITNNVGVAICYGKTYGFGSQVLSTAGTYTGIFTAASGCDSTVSLTLAVGIAPVVLVKDTAYCGPLIFEGTLYNFSTILHDTFKTINGCDSAYRTMNITIHNNNPTVTTIDTFGCNSVVFENHVYSQSIAFADTVRSYLGCDSFVRNVNIIVNNNQTFNRDEAICAGNTFNFNGQQYNQQGAYPVKFISKTGCDSTIIINLKVNPLPHILITEHNAVTHCLHDSVNLIASGASTYTWINTYGNADNETMKAFLIEPLNVITVMGQDQNGCVDTASVTINAQTCCNLMVPTAFSPNGDGLNDRFKPETNGHPNDYSLRVFDRWGRDVFITFRLEDGWDGTFKGKTADIGTYYYVVSGTCTNGEPIRLKGSLTLIR
jgi:gliding motility-associated-like protein